MITRHLAYKLSVLFVIFILLISAVDFSACATPAPTPTPTPSPTPIPAPAPTPRELVELKHDDGHGESTCSIGRQFGFLIHFSPPTTPFLINEVKLFTSLRGSGYDNQITWFEIRDENLDVLYYCQKPATTFSQNSSWVTMEIPSIPVSEDFYIVFYPCSQKEGGVYLHCDLSQMNNHSKMAEPGGKITEWIFNNLPKDKTNWMMRVVGAPTDELVSVPTLPFQTIEGSAEFKETVDSLDNPEKLSQWMIENIRHESHYERWKETGINYVVPPDETFVTKVGCCAEFSVFACYVLQYNNYQAEIIRIEVESDQSKNHAVCVYHSNGSLYIINNGRIEGPYQTYEDIAFAHPFGWSKYEIFHSWDKYQKLGPPDKLVNRS